METTESGRPGRGRRVLGVVVALFGVGVVLAVAVLPGGGNENEGEAASPGVHLAEATTRFPTSDLEDWVSFANQYSTFTVVDERELPNQGPPNVNGGLILREVTVRVDEILWSRPGVKTIDSAFDVVTWGWMERDGARVASAPAGAERLEVGRRYVAPIVHCRTWFPVSDEATLRVVDGELVAGQAGGHSDRGRAVARLVGSTPREAGAIVATTAPRKDIGSSVDPGERVKAAGFRDPNCG